VTLGAKAAVEIDEVIEDIGKTGEDGGWVRREAGCFTDVRGTEGLESSG
jgi:hypothetical protein